MRNNFILFFSSSKYSVAERFCVSKPENDQAACRVHTIDRQHCLIEYEFSERSIHTAAHGDFGDLVFSRRFSTLYASRKRARAHVFHDTYFDAYGYKPCANVRTHANDRRRAHTSDGRSSFWNNKHAQSTRIYWQWSEK